LGKRRQLEDRIFYDVTFEQDDLSTLEEELAPLCPSANHEATYDVQHVKNRVLDTESEDTVVSDDDPDIPPPKDETVPLPATLTVLDF
jgi:hypothetical protein